MYRTPEDITALLQLTIDSCLQLVAESELTDQEKKILDNLNDWKLRLEPQTMHLFEAPLDTMDFKALLKDTLKPIIDTSFELAREDGIITEREQKLLDTIVEKLNI